jgi:hypothetical protein
MRVISRFLNRRSRMAASSREGDFSGGLRQSMLHCPAGGGVFQKISAGKLCQQLGIPQTGTGDEPAESEHPDGLLLHEAVVENRQSISGGVPASMRRWRAVSKSSAALR